MILNTSSRSISDTWLEFQHHGLDRAPELSLIVPVRLAKTAK